MDTKTASSQAIPNIRALLLHTDKATHVSLRVRDVRDLVEQFDRVQGELEAARLRIGQLEEEVGTLRDKARNEAK